MEKYYQINFQNGDIENKTINKWFKESLKKAFEQKIDGAPSTFEEFKSFTLNLLKEKEGEILQNEYNSWEPSGPFIKARENWLKTFCYHSVADFLKDNLLEEYTPGQE